MPAAALLLITVLASAALAGDVPFGAPTVIATNPAEFSSLARATALAPADLDGDGDRDIVTTFASGAATIVAWLENAPAWPAHPLLLVIGAATSLAGDDLDADGDRDIVMTTTDPGTIVWLESDGATPPSFTSHAIAGSASARSAAMVDMNGDGDLDLLLVNNGNVLWFENDGAAPPSFIVRLISTGAGCAEAVFGADVDGDGDLDAVSASSCDGKIRWHENDGGSVPSFSDHEVTGTAPGVLAVAGSDLDADGDIDVIGAAPDTAAIAWYQNDGAAPPSFTARTVGLATDVVSVATADLDRDGHVDVLSRSRAADGLAWHENDGASVPAFAPHSLSLLGDIASAALAHDVDGDGDADVITCLGHDQAVAVLENRTLHTSATHAIEHVIDAAFDEADEGSAFDLDGDGDLDALAVSRAGNTVAWWQNLDRQGGAWLKRDIDASVPRASAATAADLDGDGDLDVIGCSFNLSDVYWWKNLDGSATTWSRATIDAGLGGAQSVAAADIDGDGDLDVVANGENADDVTWYANADGHGGAWQLTVIDASFDGANFVVTGDVDDDGDIDVASAARNGDELAWWENVGGTGLTWSKHGVATGFDLAAGTDLADVDGDGDLDVLGAAFNINTVAWWENLDSFGTSWTQHVVNADFTFAIWVQGSDVDGDGDIDLVGAAHNQGEISWFENLDGKGTQWLEHSVITGFDIVTSAVACDIDGDGDRDILGVAAVEDAVKWWENRGGQFALATTSTAPTTLKEGATDDVLAIVAAHRGRAGDGDELLARFALLLEQSAGVPLTSAQADAIFRRIAIHLDDGSLTFEPGLDALVIDTNSFTLVNGVLTIGLASAAPLRNAGPPKVRLTVGAPRTCFVVVELESDAADHGIGTFAVTHVAQAGSRGLDFDFRLPITLEAVADVGTGAVTIVNN